MSKGHNQSELHPPPFDARWSFRIAMYAVVVTPLVVYLSGADAFRLPKDLFLRACAAVILAILLIGAVWSRRAVLRSMDARSPQLLLPLAMVTWTVISALLSVQRILSAQSVLWVASAAILFIAIERSAASHPERILFLAAIPALLNTIVAALQELRIWNPFIPLSMLYNKAGERITGLRGTVGFLGNPNDIGMVLLPTFICALAASSTTRRHRVMAVAVTGITLGGLLVAQSAASFIAAGAAVVTMAFLSPPRIRWAVLGTLFVAVAAGVTVPAVRHRIANAQELIVSGRYEEIVSGRIVGSLAAWQQFSDHPVAGTGAGTYGYEFFDYSIRVRERWPNLFPRNVPIPNYGEAHNDHLQVLATTGIVGYALMLAAIAFVGSRSLVPIDANDERACFVHRAALPLAVGFAISALAQFPLELAAAVVTYMFYAALCVAWVAVQRTVP